MRSTDFLEVMSQHSDEFLKYIVICGKDDYQPLAIVAAEEVLKKRNVSISASEIEQMSKEYLECKEQEKKRKEQEEQERKQSFKKKFKIWLILVAVGIIFYLIEGDIAILFVFAIGIPLLIKKFSIDELLFPRKSNIKSEKFACPCCGYRTFDIEPDGTYEICPICFWEDDPIQLEDPNLESGANNVSLKQGQRNFIEFRACDKEMIKHTRKPKKSEQRDENWKMLE